MSLYSHTIHYDSKAEFVAELERLLEKVLTGVDQEQYEDVRARYPHLKPSAFTMRLRRFEKDGRRFPHTMKLGGVCIDTMFVTLALDAYLKKPLRMLDNA